jgi:HD-like signal output (HDOD) protein
VIAGIDSLPVLPDCYIELVEALADEGVSMKRIGDILSRDMALSASVLRVVNCPLFGFPARISSVHHAASLLGTQILRSLVLSSHLFAAHEGASMPGFSIRLLWDHSIRVAGFAKRIAEVEGLPEETRDDCVIAGMLHDIGKLILAASFSVEFAVVLSSVRSEGISVHAAERNVFGTSHAEVGAYLLGMWGFNHAQMGAVHAHQAPPSNAGTGLSAQFIVSVANGLDHELVRIHRGYALHALELPQAGAGEFDARIASWRDECRNKILEDATVLDRMT